MILKLKQQKTDSAELKFLVLHFERESMRDSTNLV